MHSRGPATDYETYTEIMGDLMRPIASDGLNVETLRRLYESKIVYLENLRVKCFWEMNTSPNSPFSQDDYLLILQATHAAKNHLRDLLLLAISSNLARRKVV